MPKNCYGLRHGFCFKDWENLPLMGKFCAHCVNGVRTLATRQFATIRFATTCKMLLSHCYYFGATTE